MAGFLGHRCVACSYGRNGSRLGCRFHGRGGWAGRYAVWVSDRVFLATWSADLGFQGRRCLAQTQASGSCDGSGVECGIWVYEVELLREVYRISLEIPLLPICIFTLPDRSSKGGCLFRNIPNCYPPFISSRIAPAREVGE